MGRIDIGRRTAFFASAAFVALGATGAQAQDDVTRTAESDGETIIVTAQRRAQQLIDVPLAVTAVGEETLERQQADSFSEYTALVPGFSITQENPGETRLVLRGVNTGSVGSTVGVYVDETPFGSSTSLGNAAVLAGDFDTFDMARIEVVRGPQGTLYGANALGGVLKFVTNAPRLGQFEGRAQAGLEAVDDGGLGYSFNALVNVPLGDSAAVRASGYYRRNPGFIDSIGREASDVDDSESYGGRLSVLVEPADNVSIRLTGIAQNIRAGAPSSYDVDPETLDPIDTDPYTGDSLDGRRVRAEFYPVYNDVDYRLANGTLNWDFGGATLTSSTSYAVLDQAQVTDNTVSLGATISGIYAALAGVTDPLGVALFADIRQEKFTQEVRLASADSDRFEWLVGVYYTDETVNLFQNLAPFRLSDQFVIDSAIVGEDRLLNLSLDSSYEEIAGFANATLHLGPQFEISAGARYSHNEQDSVQRQFGGYLLLVGQTTPQEITGDSSENVFTWSISALYEPSDNASLYARVAKGYRPGGPNAVPPGAGPDFPAQFNADTLIAYEAGVRYQTDDRRIALDVSAYYNDWNDILIFGSFPSDIGPVGANDNGGGARTYGLEASALFRPVQGLSIGLNAALNSSELTDDTPAVTAGLDGDELPYSPSFSGTATVDYEWRVGSNARAFVGGNLRFVGSQTGGFDGEYRAEFGRRIELPSYEALDLRAGVDFGTVSVTAFVRNVTDSDGLVSLGSFGTRPILTPPAVTALLASPLRPRTIGVTLGVDF